MSRIGLCALVLTACLAAGCNKSGAAVGSGLKSLKSTTITPGSGTAKVANGDRVMVAYVGRLLANKKEFERNEGSTKPPLMFVVGNGAMIKGWDQGVVGMTVGETRKLEIPAELGYGPNSRDGIPENSDLEFEITLLDMVKKGEEEIYDAEDVKVGSGAEVKVGDKVRIHYRAVYANGHEFDNSRKRGKTADFTVGSADGTRAVKGVDHAVRGMKIGGIRRARIAPELIFGESGGASLQGGHVIKFEIELVGLNGQ